MNIYLIRHAQTTANALGKVFSGSTNVSLSEEGRRVTQKVADNALWSTISHVYVTPLIRSQQTADILFSPSVPRTIVPEFAEVDFGTYEGKMRTKENENDPVFFAWCHDPTNLTFPGGENLLQHAKASLAALMDVIENSTEENIAIVSHATTIRLLLSLLMTGEIRSFRSFPCDNSCVTLLKSNQGTISVGFINAPI